MNIDNWLTLREAADAIWNRFPSIRDRHAVLEGALRGGELSVYAYRFERFSSLPSGPERVTELMRGACKLDVLCGTFDATIDGRGVRFIGARVDKIGHDLWMRSRVEEKPQDTARPVGKRARQQRAVQEALDHYGLENLRSASQQTVNGVIRNCATRFGVKVSERNVRTKIFEY